jgi:hypothetical protein
VRGQGETTGKGNWVELLRRRSRGRKEREGDRCGLKTARASQERARAPSGASHTVVHMPKRERRRGVGQTVHGSSPVKQTAELLQSRYCSRLTVHLQLLFYPNSTKEQENLPIQKLFSLIIYTTLISCSYSTSGRIEEILKGEDRHKKLPFEH